MPPNIAYYNILKEKNQYLFKKFFIIKDTEEADFPVSSVLCQIVIQKRFKFTLFLGSHTVDS